MAYYSTIMVQALGGWKTERMMKRYAAVTDQTLRAAAEAVSGSESVHARQACRHGGWERYCTVGGYLPGISYKSGISTYRKILILLDSSLARVLRRKLHGFGDLYVTLGERSVDNWRITVDREGV